MVDPIWPPKNPKKTSLFIKGMQLVILYVFEGAQSEYPVIKKKQNGGSNMAAIIPPKTFFEDQSHVGSLFICF